MIENKTQVETNVTLTTSAQTIATYSPGSEVWYIDRVEVWFEDYDNSSGSPRPVELRIYKVDPDNDSPIQDNQRPTILRATQNIQDNTTDENIHQDYSVGEYVTRTNLELVGYNDRSSLSGTLDIIVHARRVQ
jgi:hypothetical protein